jgi:hypothetical protein
MDDHQTLFAHINLIGPVLPKALMPQVMAFLQIIVETYSMLKFIIRKYLPSNTEKQLFLVSDSGPSWPSCFFSSFVEKRVAIAVNRLFIKCSGNVFIKLKIYVSNHKPHHICLGLQL